MFALNDRTRRLICRTAFLAACVLPALGVLVWSTILRGTPQRRACEATLSRAIGLRATVESVAYPRPGITLYEGVELADAETGAPLIRCRFLEAGGNGGVTACVVSQPEFDALRLVDFWQLLASQLREADGTRRLVRISAGQATLHWPAGSQTLAECLAQFDLPGPPDAPRIAMLSFRVAGQDAVEPVRLKIVRTLKNSQPVTSVEFHTAGAALPVDMLAAALRTANHLGSRAKFSGSVWFTETAEGIEGELTGQLTDVDFQQFVTEQFPHRLSGTAAITIQKARFGRGRLEEAAGTLSAGPGAISRSLITAAATHLHLVRGSAPEPTGSLSPYEELAVAFVIDSSGITLHGQCQGAAGAILQSHDGVLLSEATGPSGPVVALLRMLVPESEVQVPATRESDWLAARLPLPQVMPPPDQPPQGRLRLKPSAGGDASR
jgi:hypothetical protein